MRWKHEPIPKSIQNNRKRSQAQKERSTTSKLSTMIDDAGLTSAAVLLLFCLLSHGGHLDCLTCGSSTPQFICFSIMEEPSNCTDGCLSRNCSNISQNSCVESNTVTVEDTGAQDPLQTALYDDSSMEKVTKLLKSNRLDDIIRCSSQLNNGTEEPHPILITSATAPYHVEWVNREWSDTWGWSSEEIVGHDCKFLQGHFTDSKTIHRFMSRLLKTGFSHMKVWNHRKDDTLMESCLHCMPLVDDCGPGFSSQISHIAAVITECREVTLTEDDMLAVGLQQGCLYDDVEIGMPIDRRDNSKRYPHCGTLPCPSPLEWSILTDSLPLALLLRYTLRSQASIVVTDLDLRIVHVNNSWVNSTGYNATQCSGQFLPSLFYDGKGRGSNSDNGGGSDGASNGGYHLKGGNSIWRAKSNDDINSNTNNDMMNHSSRPFGVSSSSIMTPDNHEVINQLKLFRKLIRRTKHMKKNKKPRGISERTEDTVHDDRNIHIADRTSEPQQLPTISKHDTSFGVRGSNSSDIINNSIHGHRNDNDVFLASNHGSLVKDENFWNGDDSDDDDEVDDDIITANVTVCLDISTPTPSRRNSFSFHKSTVSNAGGSNETTNLKTSAAVDTNGFVNTNTMSASRMSSSTSMSSLPIHNPRTFTKDAPLYPAWAASVAPSPCQGKKSNSGRLYLPLTVCPGAIRDKHLAFLFVERTPDLQPFILSLSRKRSNSLPLLSQLSSSSSLPTSSSSLLPPSLPPSSTTTQATTAAVATASLVPENEMVVPPTLDSDVTINHLPIHHPVIIGRDGDVNVETTDKNQKLVEDIHVGAAVQSALPSFTEKGNQTRTPASIIAAIAAAVTSSHTGPCATAGDYRL